MLKIIVPAIAALALGACASTPPDKSASGAQAGKTFLGKWEVRAKSPFRTEEGPLESYTDESATTAIAGGAKPRS